MATLSALLEHKLGEVFARELINSNKSALMNQEGRGRERGQRGEQRVRLQRLTDSAAQERGEPNDAPLLSPRARPLSSQKLQKLSSTSLLGSRRRSQGWCGQVNPRLQRSEHPCVAAWCPLPGAPGSRPAPPCPRWPQAVQLALPQPGEWPLV